MISYVLFVFSGGRHGIYYKEDVIYLSEVAEGVEMVGQFLLDLFDERIHDGQDTRTVLHVEIFATLGGQADYSQYNKRWH